MKQDIVVFIGSASDLAKERKALSQIVDEINSVIEETMNAKLSIYRYEHEGMPDYGGPPQQLLEKHAIDGQTLHGGLFMLWHRYGTPVEGASSGWESELKKLEQIKANDDNAFPIKFLINNTKVSPRDVDTDQLKMVNDFIDQVPALYGTFSKPSEFKPLVKRCLIDIVKTAVETVGDKNDSDRRMGSAPEQKRVILKGRDFINKNDSKS